MPARKISRSIHEAARDKARAIAQTAAYAVSRRERKKVEMLFAHLKRILRLDRLRLRGPNGAKDEFLLAATAQNLRKLAKLIPLPAPIFAHEAERPIFAWLTAALTLTAAAWQRGSSTKSTLCCPSDRPCERAGSAGKRSSAEGVGCARTGRCCAGEQTGSDGERPPSEHGNEGMRQNRVVIKVNARLTAVGRAGGGRNVRLARPARAGPGVVARGSALAMSAAIAQSSERYPLTAPNDRPRAR